MIGVNSMFISFSFGFRSCRWLNSEKDVRIRIVKLIFFDLTHPQFQQIILLSEKNSLFHFKYSIQNFQILANLDSPISINFSRASWKVLKSECFLTPTQRHLYPMTAPPPSIEGLGLLKCSNRGSSQLRLIKTFFVFCANERVNSFFATHSFQ